jgi:hypothetical protein
MTRRNESVLAGVGLGALLTLALLFGCRAFNPEPVIVNLPPDTFLTGAPAETTGGIFRRHLYWYGTDADGDVVRYIWAITDSTAQDRNTPDVDEEESRFDPCDDITTTRIIQGRVVGYTDKSDSVFVFTVDRGATDSKDVTFHIVAVDDRGGCDASPARLHFFNNSLGNPQLVFRVSTFENGQWRLRWTGNAFSPIAGTPEQTLRPFIGFAQKFMISWEASSPNGEILGYKYLASQDANAEFFPRDPQSGLAIFGPVTSFVYENDTPTGPGTSGCDFGPDCPEKLRWESGPHVLKVVVQDVALVENTRNSGEFAFELNYPPESFIPPPPLPLSCETVATLAEAPYAFPQYRVPDGQGGYTVCTFAPGDTIPAGSYAIVRITGFDRYEGRPGLGPDFCCDKTLADTAVTFQAELEYFGRDQRGSLQQFRDGFNESARPDTLGFFVGPFDYTFNGRTKDELGRPDPTPATIGFIGGFRPRMTRVQPTEGDSLILKWPQSPFASRWPDNHVPYTTQTAKTLYWDNSARRYLPSAGPGLEPVTGTIFTYSLVFEGANHPREPYPDPLTDNIRIAGAIRSWAYALYSDRDPDNLLKEGGGRDNIDFFNPSSELNRLDLSAANGVQIFIPDLLWSPTLLRYYDPDGPTSPSFRGQGCALRLELGSMTLEVIGKTTGAGSRFPHYPLTVRPSGTPQFESSTMPDLGRQTNEAVAHFTILLGIEDPATGQRVELWPGYGPQDDPGCQPN